MEQCEECGQKIERWERFFCACGKVLCGTCFISPPHSFHIDGEPIEDPKEEKKDE